MLVVTGVVPYFAQAPTSYLQFRPLPSSYLSLDLSLSFKPESADGLLLYNGQDESASGDFVAFGLTGNVPEFR